MQSLSWSTLQVLYEEKERGGGREGGVREGGREGGGRGGGGERERVRVREDMNVKIVA